MSDITKITPIEMSIRPTPDGDHVVEVWEMVGGLRASLLNVTLISHDEAERIRRTCSDEDKE